MEVQYFCTSITRKKSLIMINEDRFLHWMKRTGNWVCIVSSLVLWWSGVWHRTADDDEESRKVANERTKKRKFVFYIFFSQVGLVGVAGAAEQKEWGNTRGRGIWVEVWQRRFFSINRGVSVESAVADCKSSNFVRSPVILAKSWPLTCPLIRFSSLPLTFASFQRVGHIGESLPDRRKNSCADW